MSEMDNTYAEKFPGVGGRDSSKIYATAIDDSTAAATVAALQGLSADDDFLNLITAEAGDDLAVDAGFLAAIAAALYSSAPVDDASFTFGAEAADEIDVTIQLLDADAANYAQRTMVTVWWCSDADAAVPAGPTGTGSVAAEGTSGGILEEITANKSYQCVTDETGALTLTFADDDATGDLTSYLGLMLPNGKYVVSGAMVFNPS